GVRKKVAAEVSDAVGRDLEPGEKTSKVVRQAMLDFSALAARLEDRVSGSPRKRSTTAQKRTQPRKRPAAPPRQTGTGKNPATRPPGGASPPAGASPLEPARGRRPRVHAELLEDPRYVPVDGSRAQEQ